MKRKHTTSENNPQQTLKGSRLRGLWKRILAMGLTVAMIGSTPGLGSLQASAETNEKVQGQWQYLERECHKRRRCYKKTIGNS